MHYTEKLDEAMKHLTKTGAFLTVGDTEKANTMTISWGFIGLWWGKPTFMTVVRPQRYTKELIDQGDSFTISIPFDIMGPELKICGTQSGRDIDKSQVVRFAPGKEVETPVVEGCQIYYECKIRYVEPLKEELIPEDVRKTMYKGDYHVMYFGEIVKCYQKI